MAHHDPKAELVRFLERKAFDPVLQAKATHVPAGKRDELADLQARTRAEVERFQGYPSAEAVVTNFHRDLHSHAAKEVHRRLAALNLPTLPDVREEFEDLSAQFGVGGDS